MILSQPLSLEWNAEGVELVTETGILGRVDSAPGTVRFRHQDGMLWGELFESGTWTVVGSRSTTEELVASVQFELHDGGGSAPARFDRLVGSSP